MQQQEGNGQDHRPHSTGPGPPPVHLIKQHDHPQLHGKDRLTEVYQLCIPSPYIPSSSSFLSSTEKSPL